MKLLARLTALLLLLVAGAVPAALHPGTLTCPASGAKQLSTTAGFASKATWINLQAPAGNSGSVFVGDSTVTAAANCAPGKGACMLAAGSVFLPALANTQAYDLSQTYIACSNSGDSVIFLYLQ